MRITRREVTAGGAALGLSTLIGSPAMSQTSAPDLILTNGKFTTLDRANPAPQAVAVKNGRFSAVGDLADIMPTRGSATQVIDCGGRRVIPGLSDNHIHVIRGGLNYNLELRWDGVTSLPMECACCANRSHAPPRRNGCAWSAASRSISSPRKGCRRWTRSTRPRPTRPFSSSTSTIARS
jgi:hypothetical protein